jgi:predicted dehydrogenase
MISRPLRIGILGAAKIAPISIIGPARERDDVAVTCVAAREPARARAFAQEHGIANVANSYAELLARDDVDLVHVALVPAAHAEWSIRASEAGKAVLCEKPFSRTASEARAMVAAAQRYERPLIEAFHYFHHPVLRRALSVLASGELGVLRRLYADFDVPIPYHPQEFRWRRDLGGGALMDLGCYAVHALRHAAGEPGVVSANADVQHGVDASLSAELAFPHGATGTISCSMLAASPRARLTVEGERGSLEILNYIVPQRGCMFRVTAESKTRDEPVTGPSTFGAQLQHLVDVCLHSAQPLTGGADAVANMDAIEAIYRATGKFNP